MSNSTHRGLVLSVGLVAFLLLTACAAAPPATGTATIGPSGGVLSAGDVILSVPAGALTEAVTISVRATDLHPPDFDLLSPVFAFSPNGLHFAAPVTVAITFHGDPARARLYWSADGGPGFAPIDAVGSADRFTALVTHFSDGFVGAPSTPDTGVGDAAPFDATPSVDAATSDATPSVDAATSDVRVATDVGLADALSDGAPADGPDSGSCLFGGGCGSCSGGSHVMCCGGCCVNGARSPNCHDCGVTCPYGSLCAQTGIYGYCVWPTQLNPPLFGRSCMNDAECVVAPMDTENPICCAGVCRTRYTDDNCGGCGIVCPSGTHCVASVGVCAPGPDLAPPTDCTSDADCAATSGGAATHCCNNQCVFVFDNRHCGVCGNACPPGSACAGSVCVTVDTSVDAG